MNTATHTPSGNVTVYGFACGYIEQINTDNLFKELYKEHGMYHVRSSVNNSPDLYTKFDGRTSHIFTIWESFTTLSDARKLYNKIK